MMLHNKTFYLTFILSSRPGATLKIGAHEQTGVFSNISKYGLSF